MVTVMLREEQAIAVAAAFPAQQPSEEVGAGGAVRVIPETAFVDGDRLVVSYNTIDLLDRGIEDAELGGNAPIRVDLTTGACEFVDFDEIFRYRDRGFTI